MKPPPFRYAAAETITHIIQLLEDEGGDARILAGGQSLVPLLRSRQARPTLVVDIGRVKGLRSLATEDGVLRLGACVTHRAAERWAAGGRADVITDAMRCVGHPAVRTFGTVGGSLAYADPAAEWAAVAVALDGQCEVAGPDGTRTVPVEELATGPFTTVLGHAEMITEIRLRLPGAGSGSAFYEVPAGAGDQAIAGAAVVLDVTADGVVGDVRIGLAGVGPTAVRARAAEAALRGQRLAEATMREASALVLDGVTAVGDLAASAAYRQRIAPVAMERALTMAWQRACGEVAPEEVR